MILAPFKNLKEELIGDWNFWCQYFPVTEGVLLILTYVDGSDISFIKGLLYFNFDIKWLSRMLFSKYTTNHAKYLKWEKPFTFSKTYFITNNIFTVIG